MYVEEIVVVYVGNPVKLHVLSYISDFDFKPCTSCQSKNAEM